MKHKSSLLNVCSRDFAPASMERTSEGSICGTFATGSKISGASMTITPCLEVWLTDAVYPFFRSDSHIKPNANPNTNPNPLYGLFVLKTFCSQCTLDDSSGVTSLSAPGGKIMHPPPRPAICAVFKNVCQCLQHIHFFCCESADQYTKRMRDKKQFCRLICCY